MLSHWRSASRVLLSPSSRLRTPRVRQDEVQPPEIEALAAATEPPAFDTPEAALDAFKKALQAPDAGPLAELLGLDPAKLKADENTAETYAAIQQGAAKQLVVQGEGDRRMLQIGDKLWPLPFPLVKFDDGNGPSTPMLVWRRS